MKRLCRLAIETMSLSVFLLLLCTVVSPVHALAADSMWIEPPTMDLSAATVGTKFNVTIWLNMSTPATSWSFYLTYDPTYINATGCGYTGNGKSLWSKNLPIYSVDPEFGRIPLTGTPLYAYVYHGEVLSSPDPQHTTTNTGAGSLSWVQFNVTHALDKARWLNLDLQGVFNSTVLDENSTSIENITYGFAGIVPEFTLPLLIAFSMVTLCTTVVFRRFGKKSRD